MEIEEVINNLMLECIARVFTVGTFPPQEHAGRRAAAMALVEVDETRYIEQLKELLDKLGFEPQLQELN